jgi:hypothetical protein
MQYVSLSKVPNRYPSLNNYTKFKEDLVLLNGLYPERNKVNFQLPKFEDITPIDNTTFRFVISVFADENDTSPKLFTSKTFYNDIKLAYRVNNPFFPIQALIGNGSILTINLKDYFQIFEKMEKEEKEAPVDVVKNIFITDTSETNRNVESLKKELESVDNDINKFNAEIADAESELVKKTTFKQSERESGISRLIKRKLTSDLTDLEDSISKLKIQRDSLVTKKNKLESDIKQEIKNTITTENITKIINNVNDDQIIKVRQDANILKNITQDSTLSMVASGIQDSINSTKSVTDLNNKQDNEGKFKTTDPINDAINGIMTGINGIFSSTATTMIFLAVILAIVIIFAGPTILSAFKALNPLSAISFGERQNRLQEVSNEEQYADYSQNNSPYVEIQQQDMVPSAPEYQLMQEYQTTQEQ